MGSSAMGGDLGTNAGGGPMALADRRNRPGRKTGDPAWAATPGTWPRRPPPGQESAKEGDPGHVRRAADRSKSRIRSATTRDL